MTTSIYYFSGTGNSMYIARKLAKLIHADLLSIKDAVNEDEIVLAADFVGIVFPVYNHRVPYIVKRFVDRLSNLNSKYVFAICTYGDNPCIALEYLSELLSARGGKLSCGFGVKMPYNYIAPLPGINGLFQPFVLRELPDEQQRKMLSEADQKLQTIYDAICAQKSGYIEIEYRRLEQFVDFFNLRELLQKPVWLKISGYSGKCDLSYMESVQLMDAGFHYDEQCVRCGTCAKICPVGNVKMSVKGPVWLHQCEQCFACLQWCPKAAIQFRSGTADRKRYHHPEVSLADMLSYPMKEKFEDE